MHKGARARTDSVLLRRAISLSRQAREEGNHPFGALIADEDGVILSEAMNAHLHGPLEHAEIRALRFAMARGMPEPGRATLFSSAEPCCMCAGAPYWAGVARIVYALSERRLLELTGANPANPTLQLPCRDVFARGQRRIEVVGPRYEREAAEVHRAFWR